jgi:hypothetical protein
MGRGNTWKRFSKDENCVNDKETVIATEFVYTVWELCLVCFRDVFQRVSVFRYALRTNTSSKGERRRMLLLIFD